MTTYRIIPHMVGIMPDGRQVSCFSAGIERIERTGKWTIERTGSDGSVTRGMGHTPWDSRADALAHAQHAAHLCGGEVLA